MPDDGRDRAREQTDLGGALGQIGALQTALRVEARTLRLQRPDLPLVGLIMAAGTAEGEAFAWARRHLLDRRDEGPWIGALVTHSCAREIARSAAGDTADTLERLMIEARGHDDLAFLVIRPVASSPGA